MNKNENPRNGCRSAEGGSGEEGRRKNKVSWSGSAGDFSQRGSHTLTGSRIPPLCLRPLHRWKTTQTARRAIHRLNLRPARQPNQGPNLLWRDAEGGGGTGGGVGGAGQEAWFDELNDLRWAGWVAAGGQTWSESLVFRVLKADGSGRTK